MGEFERYVPPEARQETKAEQQAEKPKLTPETVQNIQHGPPETPAKPEPTSQPEAAGERNHWRNPDGNLITPEKEEIYRSPETLPEKEPGFGPKPSLRDDPGKTTGDDDQDDTKAGG